MIGFALTPIYFYVEKIYAIHLSGMLLAPVIALSLFIITLSCMSIRYFLQRDLKKYWVSMTISIILMLLFAVSVVIPVMDNYKSFVPFCKQIDAVIPVGGRLYGYQPDETMRGAVPFYTGRSVIETEDLRTLSRF